MDSKMKALTVYGPYDARIEDVPKPEATGDMVVIKVKRTGVCATDTSIYTGECSFIRNGSITPPCRIGHEWSGIVEAVGPEVKNFRPGDRVFSECFVTCGKCDFCLKGDYMKCPGKRSIGTIRCWPGSYAEYMQVPERHLYHLPDELTYDEGALIEPAAVAYGAFKGVTLTENDTAVIYGTGAIGMISAWLAKYYGAGKVVMVGRNDDKLAIALKIGADVIINNKKEDAVAKIREMTGGYGVSLVVETSGSEQALHDSAKMLGKLGRLSIVSFYEKDISSFAIDALVLGCNTIVGVANFLGHASAVCKVMCDNPVKLDPIITHHVRFEDCLDVFEHEEKYRNEKIKIMVDFE